MSGLVMSGLVMSGPPRRGEPRGRRRHGATVAIMTSDPAGEADTVTCDFCGRSAATGDALSWTVAVENGRRKRFCDSCSRANLRAMEGKLDSEFW